ncbi:MAG: FAD-dependent oxidoreductase [Sulfuritalea sp.]|nr:FAD-dependent oxidoreductase [Sulfuritalea sp.]
MTPSARLAVIGAGLAGLSCATALQRAGLEVRVFEKSRGVAGRMSTRRGDGWQCDHGAQYFTARHAEFRTEVARWQQAGVAALWNPRLQVLNGDSLRDRELQQAAITGSLERFVGIPRMTAPARFLADALAVDVETTIIRLQHHGDGWQLCSAEGGWLAPRFDAVLLAVPAPQVVPLLQDAAPEFAALAASAGMRGAWALMLRFAAPLDLPFDAAFVNSGPLRWIARDSHKPGRGAPETWLLHASAEWSEAHIEDTADAVAAELLEAFRQLGGAAPQVWSVHRWRYADTEPALDIACAWDAQPAVGLCGDWLHGGRVEGAWLSGRELARRVLVSIATQPH